MASELLKEVKKDGYHNGFRQLGFALNDLTGGQIPYLCISQANKYLKTHLGTNISLFYEDSGYPCIWPEMARFNMKDTVFFTGDLICTSFKSLISTKNATRSIRYYYINDLEYLRSWFQYPKEVFSHVMNDKNIIKFARCKDYYNKLTDEGFVLNPRVVPDFNIENVIEVINDSKRP